MKSRRVTRSLITVVIVLIMAVSFAGCNQAQPSQTSQGPAVSTEQPTSVTSQQPSEQPSQQTQEPVVWKWTTTEAEGTAYWDEWVSICDELEARTNGEITVEMYAGGVLSGDEMEILQGVQQGSIEMAQISANILSNIVPEYDVMNLPFLFDSFEHMQRFNQTPECQELLGMMDQYGVMQYSIGCSGFAYPNSKEPIRSVNDFVGKKWRTMQVPIQLETMKALGAVPVAIPYGDVYNALKTNLVDGWQNAGSAFDQLSTYEVAKYVTELPIFSWPGTFIVSSKAYDALSDQNKQIVDDLFNERLGHSFEVLYGYNMDALNVLLEAGKMELITLDDFAPFREKTAGVYDNYFADNPSAKKYFDAINSCR